jgi:hypothetical protein
VERNCVPCKSPSTPRLSTVSHPGHRRSSCRHSRVRSARLIPIVYLTNTMGFAPVRRFYHDRWPSHFNANRCAQCLDHSVPKPRGDWALFERRKLSPRPYNRAEPGTWSAAMMMGITILAVLTIIAINEIRKTPGQPLKREE